MRIFQLIALLFLGILPLSANLIPLEDFFRKPEKTSFHISPDGNHIAYLAPYKNRLNIFVQDTRQKLEPRRVTSREDRDVAYLSWGNDNTLLYLRDNDGDENFHLYAVDLDGSSERNLTPYGTCKVRFIDDFYSSEDEIIVSMNDRDPAAFDAYKLNIATGERTLLAENPGNFLGWMSDHTGTIRIAFAQEKDSPDRAIYYREDPSQEFRKIQHVKFGDTFSPANFTFDNERLFVNSNISANTTGIVLYDLKEGKVLREIFRNGQFDLHQVYFSQKRRELTGASYVGVKKHFVFFKKEHEALQRTLESFFPNLEVRIMDENRNEDQFILLTFSDVDRGSYYYYNQNTGELKKLSDIAPWMNPGDMAPMTPIEFTARDGLQLSGYLTLPKDKDPHHLPVVVYPHGGPFGVRDYWWYNHLVQFLANRGYAVLQINYRGSQGYGKAFQVKGYKQLGRAMQDDLTDGVHWIINEGIADPDRIAIFGASYGGYAALAGATFTPDLYRCAISLVGPSNLFTLLDSFPPYWKTGNNTIYERFGHPEEDKELLRAISPYFHADKIKIPLLIGQGGNDPRVTPIESEQIVAAAKANNVDVTYIFKEDEGHGFRKQENQFEFYRALEAFLNKHMQ